MDTYKFNIYVHVRGAVEAKTEDPYDILDAVFPGGWEGEVDDVTTRAPHFGTDGYIECIKKEEDE